jgi:hypothetical protein
MDDAGPGRNDLEIAKRRLSPTKEPIDIRRPKGARDPPGRGRSRLGEAVAQTRPRKAGRPSLKRLCEAVGPAGPRRARRGRPDALGIFDPTRTTAPVRPSGVCATASGEGERQAEGAAIAREVHERTSRPTMGPSPGRRSRTCHQTSAAREAAQTTPTPPHASGCRFAAGGRQAPPDRPRGASARCVAHQGRCSALSVTAASLPGLPAWS